MIMLGELRKLTPEEAATQFRREFALIRTSFSEIRRRTPIRFARCGTYLAFLRKLDPTTRRATEELHKRLFAVRMNEDFDWACYQVPDGPALCMELNSLQRELFEFRQLFRNTKL